MEPVPLAISIMNGVNAESQFAILVSGEPALIVFIANVAPDGESLLIVTTLVVLALPRVEIKSKLRLDTVMA